MINKANHLYKVDTMCSDTLYTTEEHPFYVRKKYYEYDPEIRHKNGKMKRLRKFKEPQWIKAKDLNKDCYVGIAINHKWELPKWNGIYFDWSDGRRARKSNKLKEKFNNPDFWWLIGRYIGDGWIRSQGGIVICCNYNEVHEITEKLHKLDFSYSFSRERTVVKIHLAFKEIEEYVKQFGRGAENKHLTSDIFNLPSDLLIGFIEGYKSADGFVNRYGYNKISSVSKELIYGMGQCIAKAYQRPYSIYHAKRKPTCTIENRIVNQKDTYTIVWKEEDNKQDKAFYDGKYLWCPINKIEKIDYDGLVYNMEVANDNSYTVNNIIVHNCQDISVAGKTRGIIKGETRSGLLYECERIIEHCKPKYLLMENVKNLVGKKFKPQFDEWLDYLKSLGYTSYWKVLNAKDYGVPQNRERVFVVSILGDHEPYEFPSKIPLNKCLADILEDEVDEKYYLSEEIQKRFRLTNQSKNVIGTTKPDFRTIGQRDAVYSRDGIMGALVATDYKQPKQIAEINKVGMLDIKGSEQVRRVYGTDGISPTLDTMQGGHRQPKIICEQRSDKRVIEYEDEQVRFSCTETSRDENPEIIEGLDFVGGIGDKDWAGDNKKLSRNYPQGNRVYNSKGIACTQTSNGGGLGSYTGLYLTKDNGKNERVIEYKGEQITLPCIGASRGRNPENPSSRISGEPTEQRLEINTKGTSNTITTVQKDNYAIDTNYRIRKLTPRECFRLMGLNDDHIDKIQAAGISNTQQYKMAGNSIVVPVLEAIFRNLFIQ